MSRLAIACLLGLMGFLPPRATLADPQPIRVGILHALTGDMATHERPLVATARLAIAGINRQGGLLDRPLEAVVADSGSDPALAAREAERLITRERVSVLFGCWTSACRKAVKPVVEKYHHLLVYPLQYEGLEHSSHLLYAGAAPNQQMVPAFIWAVQKFGPRVYLAGSDYIFPRAAHLILRQLAHLHGATIVGESYLPLGEQQVAPLVADIVTQKPDIVLNTINGDTNLPFFRALQTAGAAIPVLSFSLSETIIHRQPAILAPHHVAWSYFQSLDTPENRQFRDQMHQQEPGLILDDPMVTTHVGIQLWAQAVREAQSAQPEKVDPALLRQSLNSPMGIVSVDRKTRHLWRPVHVGQIQAAGTIQVVASWERTIRPTPFPEFQSKTWWENALLTLLPGGKP